MIWKTTLAFLVTLLHYNLKNFKFLQVTPIVIFATFSLFLMESTNLQAQVAPVNPPTGGFHIDGNLQANILDSGVGDWIPGTGGTGGFVFDMNGTPVEVARTIRSVDSYNSGLDNVFQGGSKSNDDPNNWSWTNSKANGKSDINNVLIHIAENSASDNNDQWIIIASDRLVTNGTSYIDFEFLQSEITTTGGSFQSAGTSGGRTIGDLLIAVEYSNGGNTADVKYYRWEPVGSGFDYVEQTSVSSNFRFGKTNTVNAPTFTGGAFGTNSYSPYQFVEAAVNVTEFFKFSGDPCDEITIGNILVKTKTSNAPTAALVDFVTPIAVKLNLGTADIIVPEDFCGDSAKLEINGVQNGTFSTDSGDLLIDNDGLISITEENRGNDYEIIYTFTTAGCEKTTTTTISIPEIPDTPEIIATNANCDNENGSITVSNFDSNLNYILIDKNGADTSYSINTDGEFTEVVPGSYTVRVENADCSATSTSATIQDSKQTPDTPEITATNADCENANGSITVTNLDNTLEYILVDDQRTNTAYEINESGVFTQVAPGSYTVRVENEDCSATSTSATIQDSEQTPVTPEITATDADCGSADGSITVTNLDNTLEYILVDDQGTDTAYEINESGVFTQVAPGSYSVRIENEDCSATSVSATIEDSEQTPDTPEITATDADCESADGSITVTNLDNTLEYVLVDDQGTDTANEINENGVFTQVAPGSYTVRVENEDCSATSTSATIQDSEQTPVTPEITATNADCESANGSITVTNLDNTLEYILVDDQGTDTAYEINESGVFTQVAPGSYTVRMENEDCSATSVSATIEDSEQTPDTPEITATDADCESADGSITVTNLDNTLEYVLVDDQGTDTANEINENGVFTQVAPGSYTVRVENADCSATSTSATIQDSEQSPDTPEITATNADCESAEGSITVTNLDNTLEYILVDDQGTDTAYEINESGVFTQVAPGSYTVRVENADCSATSTSATIQDSKQTPDTPEITATNADCENANGNITVTNLDNTLEYVLVDDQGTDTAYEINGDGVFIEVAPGFYTVRAENEDCNATSVSATIIPSEQTPVTPEISATDANCNSAEGRITVTNFDNTLNYVLVDDQETDTAYEINGDGVFTEIAPGSYTVRAENYDCNATSVSATITSSEETPVTPEITATDASCESADGSITVSNYDSNLTYILVNSDGDTQYAINESGVFPEVTPGDYTVRVENADCSANSASATINPSEQTPVTPEITATNADCDSAEGSIAISNYDGNLTYILVNSDGDTQYTINESGVFTEVTSGAYTVRAENNDCSVTSASVTIEDSEQTPEAPVAEATQPTCDTATGSIEITSQGYEFSIDGKEFQTSNIFEELEADTYSVYTRNEDGCVSEATQLTINDQPGTPEQPTITSTTDVTCGENNGEIVFQVENNLSYTLTDNDNNTFQHKNGEYTELSPGDYTLNVSNGDCEIEVQIIIEDIEDNEAPVIAEVEPINTTTDADSCGAMIEIIAPQVSDNCSVENAIGTRDDNQALDVEYPVGTTMITWTVTDENGNEAEPVEQTVTVTDDQAPVIAEVEPINTTTDADSCGAMIEITAPQVSDNCSVGDAVGTRDDNQALDAEYPVGTTSITWNATDENGNEAEPVVQTVTVTDDQAPVIAEVEPINTTTDADSCGAMIEITAPQVSDNCSVEGAVGTRDDNQALDAEYPVGTTMITWNATDENGNEAEPVEQSVTVTDDQAPVIADVEPINTTTDADSCSAMIEIIAPQVSDNCSVENAIGTRDDNLALDAEYPVGTTMITWTATDENGNEAEPVVQSVTVTDNQAPVIAEVEPINTTTDADSCGAMIEITAPQVSDNCSVEGAVGTRDDNQTLDAEYPVGTTMITWTATDENGNEAEPVEQSVTVTDDQAPVIAEVEPINTTTDADSCGAMIEITAPQVSDNCSVENAIGTRDDNLALDAEYPVGTTMITWTATDENGNEAEPVEQSVTVTDDQAPVIAEIENITVNTDVDSCSAIVDFDIPSASDNCGIASTELTEGLASGSEFPLGETTITFTATDINGNSVNSSFTVTVIDNEAPVIACPENILLNVEFGTEAVVVNYDTISVSDNCSETSIELIEGFASGEEFPVGETRVTYEVTDAAGNSASCSFTVIVEEDPEETPPVPDAPLVELIQPDCVTPTGVILIDTQDGLTYSIDGENYEAVEEFTELEPGTYEVTARDEFEQISEATVVTLEEPVADEIETSTISLCTEDTTFDLFELLEGDYDTSGTWIDTEGTGALNQGFIDPAMLQVGTYTFEYQIENGICNSTTEVTVSINDDCVVLPCSLEDIQSSISKAVTPNGDNHNDYFTIDFASECGFTYDVKIFNRWGNKIYEATNYQNDWDGYSTNSATSSNQLPSGTYYYVLEIRNSGFEPIQGYIYLGTK
ncbi:HYR domain-containing protein [Salegentibacter sp. JZCK2]|uniref:HYR domain-containing protein n=1 Tax=Salegentibacter tibetensis TaxID=2873600 RepID=UPI001CCFFE96|nr:HYR domain-containing protein [Salegentibacter tibetensis]MBZ9730950.1 HYR domain-containing protein [Salegentibacter tibetensis]